MKRTFQLYLTDNPEQLAEIRAEIKSLFDEDIEQWYQNPTGNFKNYYRLVINNNDNLWDLAHKIQSCHRGVIEVDPVVTIRAQKGAYENDTDTPDPGNEKWNHKLTRFTEAVEYSKACGRLDAENGTGIRLAQLDTGYTRHPEISSITEVGYNFVEDNDNPLDKMLEGPLRHPSHGTRTASVIIGKNTGMAIDKNDGVFPYVKLIPYRIANSVVHVIGSSIDEALLHAIDNGCEVVTMSMGGWPPRRSWREAVQLAHSRGVIFCSAAGNNVGFVVHPAAYDEVIGVAAVNVNKTPWEGSSHGKGVDIAAPGEKVFVANSNIGEAGMTYSYGYGSGTSHATPHVASAAALWINHYKEELKVYQNDQSMRVELFRSAIKMSANIPGPDWQSNEYGAGILDARKLLDITPAMAYEEYQRTIGFESTEDVLSIDKPTMSLEQKEFMYLAANPTDENQYLNDMTYIVDNATPRTLDYLSENALPSGAFESLMDRIDQKNELKKLDPLSVIHKVVLAK